MGKGTLTNGAMKDPIIKVVGQDGTIYSDSLHHIILRKLLYEGPYTYVGDYKVYLNGEEVDKSRKNGTGKELGGDIKIKISESDFLVIWDALHTEATIEAVALALKLVRARAHSRSNKNYRRGAVAAQKKHV